MKNFNLFNLKSIVRSKARWLLTLITLLTLGAGQMWAGESFWQVDMTYSFNGTTGNKATFKSGDDKVDATALGTLSSGTFTITEAKWYCWADWEDDTYCFMWYNINGGDVTNKSCYSSGDSYKNTGKGNHYPTSNYTWEIASSEGASGSYEFNFGWYSQFSWGSGSNTYDIKNKRDAGYKFTYSIAPPAVSGFGVTASGYLAGSGTSEDPYLVKSGSSLTLTVAGSKAHTDGNSTLKYWLNSGSKQTSSTITISNVTATTNQTAVVHAQCINNTTSSLVGTESTSSTIYYKAVSVKDITVYIYVGGRSDAEAQSVEINAYTPYVGDKALASGTIKTYNYAGADPKFTRDGDWLSYTFEDVTQLVTTTCARAGGNIFTSLTLTDDVYYKFDGTELPGKCIAASNPTWGTAPANAALGAGTMTATVSGAPTGATISWSSNNSSAISVNPSGVITYNAVGNATITAHVTWDATGDYCAGSYDLTKGISCTSGATVSVERTCAEYVYATTGQVKLHITSTGASTGWRYRIKHGWDTGYETPDWVDASSNSADWTMSGGIGIGTYSYLVELYNSTNALIASSSTVSVTGESAESVTIAAGANGSVSPSGTVYANNNHVHPTITATPHEHYNFVNWTSNNAAASVAKANNATTTVTATASGYTITANFAGDQYTITYKDKGDVTYSGNNEGSLPATHTYGTATALVNGTKAGYTFGGWYTDASCTSSAGSSIGATAKTSNFTLYAKWTEVTSTLTTSNSYDAGSPGYAVPTKTVSSIGITTTATITATAAGAGYTFAGWTITNGTRTDGGAATANPITVCSDGTGAAVTVQANYTEDLSSQWHLVGASSDFPNGWNINTTTMMQKASGHSTEDIVYFDVNVTSTTAYEFKIVDDDGANDDIWYGYSNNPEYQHNWTETGTKNIYAKDDGGENHNSQNLKYTPTVVGTYTFKVDYSSSPVKVTITYPTSYTLTYSIGSVAGNNGSITTSPSTTSGSKVVSGNSVTLTAPAAKTGYTWKGWYTDAAGTEGKITDSNRAITVTMDNNKSLYACYTLNNHAITHSAASNGSYTIKVGSASAVSTNTNSDYGKTITLAATPSTGYHLVSWSVKKTSDASVSVSVSSNQFAMPDYPVTVSATFAANTYTVVFNKHKGDYYGTVTGTMANQGFTYDAAATALRANTYALTGYTFLGWSTHSAQNEENFNASANDYDYLDGASVSNLTATNSGTVTMYAIWRPIQYTITYNANGGTCGTSSQTAYFYNTVTGAFPVALKTNKHFNGWYTAASDGTQLATNSAWLENVTDYLTSYKWIKPIDTEVFAQYSDPAMGTTTFSATAVAKGGTVTVYPHVTIAPDDSYSIWLELQNMDGTPVATQPAAFSTAVGEVESVLQKTFTAPTIGSTYKVVATMRTGSTSSGTVLATAAAASFEVETDHVITIVYQDASGNTIHPSGMTTALQSEYTEVTAPDILGYSFSNWESSNLTDMWFDTDAAHDADNNPANIKAQANATLIAHYNEKEMIYFYNNLGWEDVWVYFYSAGGWWDNAKGSGSSGANCLGHGHMTQIAGTNVWYLDYTNTANTGGANVSSSGVVCFNKYEQNGYDPFYGTECAYRSDFCSNATMPMYVPHTTPSKVISEKSTNYYNYGYWMHYPNQTGYQLRVYNQALTDGAVEQTSKSTDFVASASIPMPFTATMSLEAGQTLYFKVSTQDGKWYHNANTMTAANHEQWEILNESGNNTGITATAAGDYTFTLYYDIHSTDAATAEPKFRISVEYPLSEGDYRLMYSDNAHSAKVPSHIIHNVAGNVDTVNFYVRKGQSPVIRVDKCANIAANGTITWTEGVTTNLVSGKTFDKDTVYNIIVTVNEGATNVNYTAHEYYSGNYYIRTDAVSNGWDHYTIDADHQMVYSEYSMTLATNPYTYYKAKWATHGTNIKAVVATDYSPAVSDTLKGDDVISGLEPTVPGTGDAGANIRFSYNASTNTLYHAYLAGAQGGAFDPDFLKLTEDPDNNKMKDDGGSDIDYITFTDDGNWLYSATITASPGLQGALTAKYNGHTQTFYTTGTTILGGEGSEAQSILLRYDFKTGRLIRAWLPNGDITKNIDLQADMILIRHGQSDEPNGGVTQLTFTNGSVLNVETAYGVIELRYNDMVGQMNSWSDATSYRYCYYYLSFPFDVKISTIIGPGRYDYEWDIQQYRGDLRASEGWFLADGRTTFWETMPQSGTLHKNVGYLLRLSRADFNVKVAGGVWDNKSAGSKLYFYFPSTSALGTITDHTNVPLYVPEHVCEIDRIFTQDIEAGKTTEALGGRNHKYTDSNWNMIGSPLFENQTGSVVSTTALYDSTAINYLYTWNYSSNSLSVTRAHNFTFNSMYGYMVQFAGQINFTGASIGAAVAARRLESEKNYTIEMQLFKGDTQAANTYIELKDDGHDNYMLNEDLYLMASGKTDLYTYAGGYDVAANILSVNNHVIPVGVKTNAAGEYTFSMPSDFDGTVVLVDNFDGSRTDLSLGDYSVALPKGTIEDRFTLEINIERSSATDIEGIEGGTIKDGKAHKFVRDGIMYILRDGVIYDAMGKRVK